MEGSTRVFNTDPVVVVDVLEAELRASGFQFALETSTTDFEHPAPICLYISWKILIIPGHFLEEARITGFYQLASSHLLCERFALENPNAFNACDTKNDPPITTKFPTINLMRSQAVDESDLSKCSALRRVGARKKPEQIRS